METQLVNLIISYLTQRGHFVWRNNSGVVRNTYTSKGGVTKDRVWRAGLKGGSDIIGISKHGRFIAIECKVKGNKPTPAQSEFLDKIIDKNGIGILAYSLEDVKEFL